MGEYPWNMHRAKDYLWNWVQQNKSQKWPRPRDLTWVVAHVEEYRFSELPYTDEWKKFAPARPVPVWVTRAPTHRIRKKTSPESVPLPQDDDPMSRQPKKRARKGCSAPVPVPAAREPAPVEGPAMPADDVGPVPADPEPAPLQGAPMPDDDDALPAPVGHEPAPEGPPMPAAQGAAAPPLVLGCGKCRRSGFGCMQCRNPAYNGRRGPAAM